MEKNIILTVVVIIILVITYKMYNRENYESIAVSEFQVKDETTTFNMYKNYLKLIINTIHGHLKKNYIIRHNSTIDKLHSQMFEYFTPDVSTSVSTDNSSFSASSNSSSTSNSPSISYPIDTNIMYILSIFVVLLIIVFIVIKYKAIIGFFSSKKSSSIPLINSSELDLGNDI